MIQTGTAGRQRSMASRISARAARGVLAGALAEAAHQCGVLRQVGSGAAGEAGRCDGVAPCSDRREFLHALMDVVVDAVELVLQRVHVHRGPRRDPGSRSRPRPRVGESRKPFLPHLRGWIGGYSGGERRRGGAEPAGRVVAAAHLGPDVVKTGESLVAAA